MKVLLTISNNTIFLIQDFSIAHLMSIEVWALCLTTVVKYGTDQALVVVVNSFALL